MEANLRPNFVHVQLPYLSYSDQIRALDLEFKIWKQGNVLAEVDAGDPDAVYYAYWHNLLGTKS